MVFYHHCVAEGDEGHSSQKYDIDASRMLADISENVLVLRSHVLFVLIALGLDKRCLYVKLHLIL